MMANDHVKVYWLSLVLSGKSLNAVSKGLK